MQKNAIEVSKLGKLYMLGSGKQYYMLREAIANNFLFSLKKFKMRSLRQNQRKSNIASFIWALKDVSFEIERGEVVGIIGLNGAGKSTLLKILSRITPPTEGDAKIYGRISPLLEIGTGFHPDLTGRENIYLNGAILGMRKSEIEKKLDEIIAFAEVEKFIDTPVKHYSSGMQLRLAFAVAAHLESEILLVDEVLAVGDAAFQKKCIGKMENVTMQGRTVLFVSHNMAAIRNLCARAILLTEGRIAIDGPSEKVVTRYLLSTATSLPTTVDTRNELRSSDISSSALRITRVTLCNNRPQAVVFCGEPFEIEIEFVISEYISEVVFGWSVHSSDNVRLFECRSIDYVGVINEINPGRYAIRTSLKSNNLNPGLFSLYLGARCAAKNLDYLPNIMSFQIEADVPQHSIWLGERSGLMNIVAEWTLPQKI